MSKPEVITIDGYPFIQVDQSHLPEEVVIKQANDFYNTMNQRRTIRDFSDKPIPREVIEKIILTASTAPSGAHKQPWTFCVVADSKIKSIIRTEAEKEEYENYHGRMPEEWLADLRPLQTNWQKEFLEIAPYLIVVFKKAYDLLPDGTKKTNYYVNESVGIACGFLLAAIHHAGLAALTHTPSPMNFLSKILKRPENERPYLLIPVGYAAEKALVPDLRRKELEEVAMFY
jgi:iodotyrosine deiodinase